MIVIGLTGSIGMGKSTVAAQFAKFGAMTSNADSIVHALLARGGAAVEPVGRHFPAARAGDAIDRRILGDIIFKDPQQRELLESILHPLVFEEEARFIESARSSGAKLAVLDVPLLFETGGESRCDYTVTATAPLAIQRRRVLSRPGMTEEKFLRIVQSQLADRDKRALADFVVQTGLGKAYSMRQIKAIMREINHA